MEESKEGLEPYRCADVFAAVLSENGYYWDLSNTSIHPLENNSDLIMGV